MGLILAELVVDHAVVKCFMLFVLFFGYLVKALEVWSFLLSSEFSNWVAEVCSVLNSWYKLFSLDFSWAYCWTCWFAIANSWFRSCGSEIFWCGASVVCLAFFWIILNFGWLFILMLRPGCCWQLVGLGALNCSLNWYDFFMVLWGFVITWIY